jgi:hypothetical protein
MGKLFKYNINSYVNDKEFLTYKYYNIIPYNTEKGNLNLIISSIKEEKLEYWNDYDYYYYYNIYLDYNINNQNDGQLILNKSGIKKFETISELLNQKNICHLLDSSFIIKCIYYNNKFWNNIKYEIKKNRYHISGSFYFYETSIDQIASSKSFKNNYLVCSINTKKYYNYTRCTLCDEYKDYYNECKYIFYLFEYDCSNIETYYLKEIDKFALICKKFEAFIIFIIDYILTEVVDEKIIYHKNFYNLIMIQFIFYST